LYALDKDLWEMSISILSSVVDKLIVYGVCHVIGRCVKTEVVLRSVCGMC